MSPDCPTADALVQFANGTLADPEALEAHLDTCSACRASTSALVRGDAVETQRFGRYQLQTVLGSGGMGIVYRAWDPELARAVAIKVVRRAGDAEHRARLVREAQSLARLSHANVCHVYDVGTDGDEVWLAMELIEGVTLRAWVAGRSEREIVAVLRDTAHGLAAAHRVGLVHRDVKPENVLVDRGGRAVVTDFGLARAEVVARAATISDDPLLTATGVVAGTPAYLAPEQITAAEVDARTDQFAWATMAWELLTGTRPFPAEAGARLAAIRAGLVRPRGIAAGAVLVRALAERPGDRFASMTALLAAIDAPPPKRRVPIAVGAVAVIGGLVAWRIAATPDVVAPIAAVIPRVLDAAIVAPPIDAAPPPIDAALPPIDAAPPRRTIDAAPPRDLVGEALRSGKLELLARADLAGFLDDCTLPADVAHPDRLERNPADWGRITRREIVELESHVVGEGKVAALLYEMQGARGTYRFEGRLGGSSQDRYFDLAVGQLVLRCPDTMRGEDEIAIYKLPGAWSGLRYTGVVTPIAHAPKLGALALRASQMTGSSVPADRPIVVVAAPKQQVDGRWDMGGWSVDPSTMRHADRLAPGRRVWLIVDQPQPDHQFRGVDALELSEIVD